MNPYPGPQSYPASAPPDSGPRLPGASRADQPSADPRLGRRAGLVVAGLILSVAAALAICNFPPLLVIGGVGAVIIAGVIVARPFVGLLIYTILYMWRPGEVYPVLGPLHAERLAGALALVGMYIQQFNATGRLSVDNTRQTRLLFLVLVTVLISVPFAYWREGAMNGFIDFVKLVAWYLLIVHLVTTRSRLRIYISLLVVLIGKIALDAVHAYFSGTFMFAQGIERAVGQTEAGGDPNSLAATMAATVPLLLLLVFYKRLRRYRILAAAGVALLTVTLLLTGSRSGLLALVTGVLFIWLRSRRRVLVGVIVAIALGFTVLLLPAQYKVRYSTIGQSSLDESSMGRIDAWKAGLRMMTDRPLTGVGIACFGTAHALGYSEGNRPNWLQAHSLYVQVPAEIGLIGALIFFFFLFEILRRITVTRRDLLASEDDWQWEALLLQGLTAGILALLVAGIFGHSFLRYTWYIYGAMSVAVLRMYTRYSSPPAPEPAAP